MTWDGLVSASVHPRYRATFGDGETACAKMIDSLSGATMSIDLVSKRS
jgi:hypothetical protein